MYVVANHVMPESEVSSEPELTQISLFDDSEEIERRQSSEKTAGEKERRLQKAPIEIRRKFGKNAILKGMNLQESGTTIERNKQVGGHKAGE